jgi:hypothetical protein
MPLEFMFLNAYPGPLPKKRALLSVEDLALQRELNPPSFIGEDTEVHSSTAATAIT